MPVYRVMGQPTHSLPDIENLIRPCILAGCPVGGIVLDPFVGTTIKVANAEGRKGIGFDINPCIDWTSISTVK